MGAFEGCTSLWSINIPDVRVIDTGAFSGCTSLENVYLDRIGEISGFTFDGCSALKEIKIPNLIGKLGKIGRCAFRNTSLQSLIIPPFVFDIEEHAFCNCPISNINVDVDNPIYYSKDDVLYQKYEDDKSILVKYAPKKKDVCFCVDQNIKMIDSHAFEGAKELEKIILHDNLLSIGKLQTFAGCTSLQEIVLPPQISVVPKEVFLNCISLKEVVLPDSDSYTIEASVFNNCESLKIIHSKVQEIEKIVVDEKAFDGFDIDECTLFVPSGTRWAYRHHPGFGKFKNIEIERKD